jgi:hypothetical protein
MQTGTLWPICKGARVPPAVPTIAPPIWFNGSIILPIGRPSNDLSPESTPWIPLPVIKPASRRIVVPELPQFMRPISLIYPPVGGEIIRRSSFKSTLHPTLRIASAVANVSDAQSGDMKVDTPSARAPSKIARCVIDLSPGSVIVPRSPSRGGDENVTVY